MPARTLLVVRKIEETNRDSTFAELQAAIYRMFGPFAERAWKVNLNPLALECRITGNRVIFRGVKDQRQREKVKSITFKGKTGVDLVRRSDRAAARGRRHSRRPPGVAILQASTPTCTTRLR